LAKVSEKCVSGTDKVVKVKNFDKYDNEIAVVDNLDKLAIKYENSYS